MKYIILSIIIFFDLFCSLNGQTKGELEDKRTKTLGEIAYVDNLLKSTAKEKDESLNAIKIIGNKLILRNLLLVECVRKFLLFQIELNLTRSQ